MEIMIPTAMITVPSQEDASSVAVATRSPGLLNAVERQRHQ